MELLHDDLSLTDGLRVCFAAPFLVLTFTAERVVSQVEVLGTELQDKHDYPNDEHRHEGDEWKKYEDHPD